MMMAKGKSCWSYNAGEPGRNWVRAFEKVPGGALYLEWMEPVVDAAESAVMVLNRRTGELQPKRGRRRAALRTMDRGVAVSKAEEAAERLGQMEPDAAVPGIITLNQLFTLYEREVTPEKGTKTQAGDRQSMRAFRAFFGGGAIAEALRNGKAVTELGRKRYNAFLRARRNGEVQGFPRKVGDRAVQADIETMRAIFNWAMVEREDGTVLMQRNPWKGFPIPREKNPRRPPLTPEIEAKLLAVDTEWRPRLALILCRETGRRLSAVRRVEMDKLDIAGKSIEWEPGYDKNGKGRITPLSQRAVDAIRTALQERGIGGRWLFPSPDDPTEPATKDYFVTYMQRWKRRASVHVPGLGYHSGKRSKIRDPEFRKLDPKIREALVDTRFETQKKIYDDVTFEDLKMAVGDDR